MSVEKREGYVKVEIWLPREVMDFIHSYCDFTGMNMSAQEYLEAKIIEGVSASIDDLATAVEIDKELLIERWNLGKWIR